MKKIVFTLVSIVAIVLFHSCDKEFSEIGSSVIGDGHFDLLPDSESTIVAYNERTMGVQSNGFPVNALGVYNNPTFGVTKAHFVTQVQLATINPTFSTISPNAGQPPIVVDSVRLYVPYFSRKVNTDADGVGTYELDSIYGGTSRISLNVYENGYFLRNSDPNADFERQKYYTDETSMISSVKIGNPLNNDGNASQNSLFFFDNKELVDVIPVDEDNDDEEAEPTITRRAPGILMKLNKDFFFNKILAPSARPNLISNSVFTNYFRGLYFESQEIPGENGSLSMIDFSKGVVTINYHEVGLVDHDNDSSTPQIIGMVPKTMDINLLGNTISLIEQTPSQAYVAALENSNNIEGDPLLWVKGNQGSLAVIKLFGRNDDDTDNGFTEELNAIRANNWLVNEANLTFHINRDVLLNSREPYRVMLYDIKNKRPLIDFSADQTVNAAKPKFGKLIHGGIIERELSSGGRGVRYKIRITNHIRNIIRSDSTNVRLGLVVTEDFTLANLAAASLRNPSPNHVKSVPAAAVMSPLGTVLYGTHSSVPEDKKLKLNIYYTKPN